MTGRFALSLFALFILYCQTAALANICFARLGFTARIPLAFALSGFDVFTVFASYETVNREIQLLGVPTDADSSRGAAGESPSEDAWISLTIDEYLPYRRGELHARLLSVEQYGDAVFEKRNHWWANLARQVRSRHNRLHPERPIAAVRFREITWPRAIGGYDALKQPNLVRVHDFYSEPLAGPERDRRYPMPWGS